MKRAAYYAVCIIILDVFWLVFNESVSLLHVLLGGILAIIALFLSRTLLFKRDYYEIYRFNPFWFLRFLLGLLLEVYASGITAVRLIISGKTNVSIVRHTSCLKSKLGQALLANAITLTPGTVTVKQQGAEFVILFLNYTGDQKKDVRAIQKLEAMLLKAVPQGEDRGEKDEF